MISVGIDVSKGHSTVCMLKPGGEVVKPPFEMQHTLEEVILLSTLSKALMKMCVLFWKPQVITIGLSLQFC